MKLPTTVSHSNDSHFAQHTDMTCLPEETGEVVQTQDFIPFIPSPILSRVRHLAFKNTSTVELVRLGIVNKKWHICSKNPEYWTRLDLRDQPVADADLKALCCAHKNVHTLSMVGVFGLDGMRTLESLASLPALQTLQLAESYWPALPTFSQHLQCADEPYLPQLQSIHFSSFDLPRCDSNFEFFHNNITEFEAVKCSAEDVCIGGRCMRTLRLKSLAAKSLIVRCPKLQELDLSSSKLSTQALHATLTGAHLWHSWQNVFDLPFVPLEQLPNLNNFPVLSSLNLSNCKYLTDTIVSSIASSCPNLKILDLSHCNALTLSDPYMRWPSLVSLKLNSCTSLDFDSLASLNSITSLQELQLQNCQRLVSVVLTMPNLTRFLCNRNSALKEISMICPNLDFLQVEQSPSLETMVVNSPRLRVLSLQNLTSLHTIMMNSPSIPEVKVMGSDLMIRRIPNSPAKCNIAAKASPTLNQLFGRDSCKEKIALYS